MKALINLAQRVKLLDEKLLMQILFRDKSFIDLIIWLNTEEQLFKQGIDSQGKKLQSAFAQYGQVYANFTIRMKELKNQPFDRVTLKDEGDFYESFDVLLTPAYDFVITADTLKEDNDLREIWGDAIIGLTDENMNKIIQEAKEIILPHVREYILRAA
jgi:hypothetical protein